MVGEPEENQLKYKTITVSQSVAQGADGGGAISDFLSSIFCHPRYGRYSRTASWPTQIERMRCPVGLDSIGGRKLAEIAIAIAAKILSIQNCNRLDSHKKREGIPWQGLKKLMHSQQSEVAQ